MKHPEAVKELFDMGVLIQVNAGSVMGKYGFGIRTFTRKLLKEHLVQFVATDAHDLKNRAPRLAECRRVVASKCGERYADKVFGGNAEEILQSAYGEEDAPEEEEDIRPDDRDIR